MAWPTLVKKIECGIGASSNSLEKWSASMRKVRKVPFGVSCDGIAGRDRPVIALDAVDRDGHHLVVLVDGDGDVGLRGAGGGEQHQTGESNEEGTHLNFGLRALDGSAALTVPRINMPEIRLLFQRPVEPSLMAGGRKQGGGGAESGVPRAFSADGAQRRLVANSSRWRRNLLVTSALHVPASSAHLAAEHQRNCRTKMKTTKDRGIRPRQPEPQAPSCGCGARSRIARDSPSRACAGHRARRAGRRL